MKKLAATSTQPKVNPKLAKQLAAEGFNFKTERFPERKPIEWGADYEIPGPDFVYTEAEARQTELAQEAGISPLSSFYSGILYYEAKMLENLKANTPFTGFGTAFSSKKPLGGWEGK